MSKSKISSPEIIIGILAITLFIGFFSFISIDYGFIKAAMIASLISVGYYLLVKLAWKLIGDAGIFYK